MGNMDFQRIGEDLKDAFRGFYGRKPNESGADLMGGGNLGPAMAGAYLANAINHHADVMYELADAIRSVGLRLQTGKEYAETSKQVAALAELLKKHFKPDGGK